ncbi:MAG: hypothetical protein P8Y97_02075, partial [Candidatus Lokiarchaeota archaeon]
MLFQLNILAEIQLLLYFIPLIIGYQLGFYFFYQYYKIKDLKLKLNRILLSYGSLFLILTTGPLFLQISRNFVIESNLNLLIAKIGWILSLSSPIIFLLFISIKQFASIINITRMRIIMVLSSIPIITVAIIPQINRIIILISILFLLLNGYYIFIFQFKLIMRVVGEIKKRIKKFLLGEILSLSSSIFAIMVGLRIFGQVITDLLYLVGIIILIGGFIIIFTSAIEFPLFYEFEWVENLLTFYIIDRGTNELIYSYNFQNKEMGLNDINKEMIISKGLTGIENIISIITGTEDEKIKEIKQDDFNILLDHSSKAENLT